MSCVSMSTATGSAGSIAVRSKSARLSPLSPAALTASTRGLPVSHIGEHGLVRGIERRRASDGPCAAPPARPAGRSASAAGERAPRPPPAPPGRSPRRSRPETKSVASTSSGEEHQRQRDQPRPEPDLGRQVERLDPHPLGQRRERREPVAGAHHVERHPPLAAGIDPRRRLRRGPRLGQPLARHPGDEARRRQRAEAVEHLQRRPDRARQRLRRRGEPARALGQPLEHLDEEPGERQARPVGARGDVEEHHPPVAEAAPGDERRPVLEARQHPVRQVGIGLRHHLARDVDVPRHRQPGEGPVLRERPQPPRRAPGHRAADRPPAGAQPDRQQRVLLELARRPTAPAAARRSG